MTQAETAQARAKRVPMNDSSRALIDRSIKSREENAWLKSLDLCDDELSDMRNIQNTYKVQLDDFPDVGYGFRIWLLWDYDRIWGIFDLGYTKGLFLIDPGPRMSECDDDGQVLPFVWRGIRKAAPDYLLCNEDIMKGEIRINPRESTLEGFFQFMAGNGNASSAGRCAFHGKRHFGPAVVPYCLEDVVEEWNGYSPLAREESVRQKLSPSDLVADLHRGDGETSVKEGIQSTLEEIKATGTFMTSGNHDTAIIPGLHISNVGSIRLPISAEDAREMIQSCHMSPYGKGTETLVNESVRKSWQLDANQFSLQNPKWHTLVRVSVDKAVTGLGLQANPLEGAFFLPHQDSEKVDGMFGTLVISLPSKHEGGDVIASHKDERLTFETAPNSEFGFSWAAWYADVTHEVKPVTSGYRIVLVYNLIHRPSAALLQFRGNKTERLTHLLKSWARAAEEPGQYLDGWDDDFNSACPPALVYILEHQYTQAELNFARLKGVDQPRFAELQNACERTGFDIFLANIEKMKTGGVNEDGYYGGYYGHGCYHSDGPHSIVDLVESTLELSHVVNAKGDIVGKDISFPENMLIPEDVFDRDPDDEDFEGFTGNEGASATHFYRETGALIMPKRFHFLFVLEKLKHGQGNAEQFLEDSRRVVREQPNDKGARQRLLQICRMLTLEGRLYVATECADSVMQIAFELADMELFGRSMVLLGGEFSSSQITQIAKTIFQIGLHVIRPSLNKVFARKGHYSYNNESFFRRMNLLSQLAKEYHLLCEEQSQKPSAEVIEWQDNTFNNILSTELRGSESDGHDLAKALSNYPVMGSFSRTAAFLETNLSNTAFVLSFITAAHDYSLTGNLDKSEVGAVLERLLPIIVQSFKIENTTSLRPAETPFALSSYCAYPKTTSRISSNTVIKLIQLADATNANVTGVMDTLVEYAANVKGSEIESTFHKFLFPVANGISKHIGTTKRPFTTSEQRFITVLLTSYVTDYVKNAPSPPPDWKVRTTIHCSCADCDSLRTFINDLHAKTKDFPMAEKRRKHLDQQIDKSYFTTSTIKLRSPYILRVEKTKARLVSNFIGWIKRAQAAQSELKRLSETAPLKEILGDNYNSIVEHKNLQIPNNVSPSLGELTNQNVRNTVQSTVSRKRPFGY
ncbi:uncharacterized protein ATNIH1004_002943 [Aspergillus tanneri]|uniref:Prolyl 4-hydroxylase alpha subunit Fe(2+) 2OG dioxygenase domain-containing protein n=1 Tax=Aspergillus tanneri TaxID=1220188 RepID=A0A5M9MSZ6_9EURO|nr:uncharacterized protein ATNIH1004_002943 [Aspergillus tanneri]KAA8650261.1 hypothetical protein ATNIH1004_002943 [Aspergillus tanneri]